MPVREILFSIAGDLLAYLSIVTVNGIWITAYLIGMENFPFLDAIVISMMFSAVTTLGFLSIRVVSHWVAIANKYRLILNLSYVAVWLIWHQLISIGERSESAREYAILAQLGLLLSLPIILLIDRLLNRKLM